MTLWNHPGFALPPVASAVGPFPSSDFLAAVSPFQNGEAFVASSDDAFIVLCQEGDTILFAGDREVTDYHSPRGEGSETLIRDLAAESPGLAFHLDSLPEEAAKPLIAGLSEAGRSVETKSDEVAAVLDLPDSFDEYLSDIGKKERHEVRRKRRRYEQAVGPVRHETHNGSGWGFSEFIRLHRLSAGDKGSFMTPQHVEMFERLARLPGWRVDLLRTPDDTAAACVFGYSDETGYFLYNSSYDPAYSGGSPGVVLLGSMIETAIKEDMPVFDFLKGDETYKFRLGARPRPLTEIVAPARTVS